MAKRITIAIDGPAGSGKSTTAKLTADHFGYLYIDTGAMYRAVTLSALKHNVITDEEKLISLAKKIDLRLEYANGITRVFVNNIEVTDEIRTKIVNQNVSHVAAVKEVRKEMVRRQREMGKSGGVVMEGRDIGSVVFPDAELKVFIIASVEERTKRRLKEFREKGIDITGEEVRNNLLQRDEIDSSRAESPLTKTPGALEIDTSDLTIDEQVQIIIDEAEKIINSD